jgi:phenylpyruvate tautomerase PptA (4-oxalocrotonate tautomerase family)
MPHIIVKLYPGRSEQQKARLAEQIVMNSITRSPARAEPRLRR